MMKRKQQATVICQICKKQKRLSEVVPAELVPQPLVDTIIKTNPDWSSSSFICVADLNNFREQYVKDVLEAEKGELSALERQVIKSLKEQELLSKNINVEFERQLTVSGRLSDRLAGFAGSWGFIMGFIAVLILWIVMNSVVLTQKPFDPYPFILLNLVLSSLAAIQAPVILMSQNRQEAKDRVRSEQDYRVNLKAELEIRHLHEEIEHLIRNQWQRLLEIQQIQMELMEELTRKPRRGQ
jgi:uncharacterized membrane protein